MLFGAYEQKLKEIRNAKGDDPTFNYLQELKQFTGTKYADALKLTERYIYKERFIPIGEDIPEEVFMLNIYLNEILLLAKELGVLRKFAFGSNEEKLKLEDFLGARSSEKLDQSRFEVSTETQTEQDAKLRFLIRARRLYLPKSFPANHRGLKFPRGKSGVLQKSPTPDIKYTTSENDSEQIKTEAHAIQEEFKNFLGAVLLFIITFLIFALISSNQ